MKKFFLLLVSLSALIACSSDDDANNTEDPILGKWHLTDMQNPYTDDELSECNKESFIDFHNDNTADSEFYATSGGECQLQDEDSGTWENHGGSEYSFNVPNFGRQRGEVEFQGNNRFVFSVSSVPGLQIVFEKR